MTDLDLKDLLKQSVTAEQIAFESNMLTKTPKEIYDSNFTICLFTQIYLVFTDWLLENNALSENEMEYFIRTQAPIQCVVDAFLDSDCNLTDSFDFWESFIHEIYLDASDGEDDI